MPGVFLEVEFSIDEIDLSLSAKRRHRNMTQLKKQKGCVIPIYRFVSARHQREELLYWV